MYTAEIHFSTYQTTLYVSSYIAYTEVVTYTLDLRT